VCNSWFLRRVSAYRPEVDFDPGHVLSRSSRSIGMRQTSTLQVEQRFSAASVSAECTHPLTILFACFECSECCSADGSAGNLTAGCGLVEDRLPRAVSAPVKSGSVSHRQVGLVAQLGKVQFKALLTSNTTMLLQPLECIALPQQHIHLSSKAKD